MEEIKLEKLLQYSPDLICTIDRRGNFLTASAAAFEMLGYRPEELAGQPFQDFIHPDDLEPALTALQEAVEQEVTVQMQNRYMHRDRRVVPLDWSARWEPGDERLYCIARSGQVTRQAESMRSSLQESIQRYHYVTKATSDAIWDWDIHNSTLYWGEGIETVFGYELAGLPAEISFWTQHIHAEDAGRVMLGVTSLLDSRETNWKDEYRYEKADGSYADVVDRGFVIRNEQGKAVRMVGAMHDISERKRGLAEAKRFTDELYQQNRELQQFGYIVSHNLRSPVANIIGITNLMEMDADDPETIAAGIRDLKTSVSRLDEVITDLTKILSATNRSAENAAEQVNISELLKQVATDLEDSLSRNQVALFLPDAEATMLTQRAYLYSIFYNLISNAIKYRSDTKPEIRVSFSHNNGYMEVIVQDNGLGMDLARVGEDLFKPYKRFHAGIEGKGLGLFLVKSHVESLGGQISVQSHIGEGTCFVITFPTQKDFYGT